MKKYLITLIMLFAIMNTAFAASLEKDGLNVEKLGIDHVVERYVYIMDRLDGSVEEVAISKESDYLGIITELNQGDLVATSDERLKFNLVVQVNRYAQNATARKLALVPMAFKILTKNEQEQYKKIEKLYIYAVEEQYVDRHKNNQIVIDNNTSFENVHYFVSMITQIKSL